MGKINIFTKREIIGLVIVMVTAALGLTLALSFFLTSEVIILPGVDGDNVANIQVDN